MKFPKNQTKKKRRKHPKSILQDKADHYCFECKATNLVLEEHHIFGGSANRRLSEEYGLKVYLCHDHHQDGEKGVHYNKALDTKLKKMGQQAFEARYGPEKFRELFGRNYL